MPEERSVKVRLKGDVSDFNRAMIEASSGTKTFSKDLDSADGRMAGLVQTSLALGPALVPISAAAIPAIAGLTNQLAFAGAAAGVAVLAFQGVGKALDAVNKYSVEPTAANLQKMREELATLGPEGQDFVFFLQRARPELQKLQDAAQAGLFPGLEAGLSDVMNLLPQFEHIVTTISTAVGDLAAEAGDNLDSPKWREFFDFIDREARPTLIEAGRTLGNFTEAFANLWMAFQPLSSNFSHSFLDLSRDFATWTDGLGKTKGFQEFVDYINRVGPKAWDTLGALGNALLQIVEAAAPVGEATLPVIKAVADAIATLADSDLGPVILGVLALTSALGRLKAMKTGFGKSPIGGLLGGADLGLGEAIKGSAATKATTELRIAQDKLAASSRSAREAQFALIPTADKRRALSNYSADLRATTQAESSLARAMGARRTEMVKAGAGAAALGFAVSGLADNVGLSNTAMYAAVGSVIPGWGTAIGAAIGFVKDFGDANKGATASVDQATEAIARNAGTLAQQKQLLEQARIASAVKQSVGDNSSVDELKASEKQYAANVKAADDLTFAEAGLSSTMAFASGETRRETLAIIDNIKAKNDAADASENAFSAETNYRQALKDAEAQGKNNNAGINGSSDAALKNRQVLDQLATSWNRVADAGDASAKDMRTARANFIRVAESMGVSKKAAEALSRELFHIPSPHPKVVLEGVNGALDKIQHVKDRLLSLDGTTAKTFVQIKESTGKADGGLVRRFDSGGRVSGPGGPRDDLIPAMLSNGEFVMNAAATARFLPELHRMNAQKFASGGPVLTRMPSSTGASASAAFGPLSVSIKGARVAVDKDGLMSFVDGRVELVTAGDNNYRNSKKR